MKRIIFLCLIASALLLSACAPTEGPASVTDPPGTSPVTEPDTGDERGTPGTEPIPETAGETEAAPDTSRIEETTASSPETLPPETEAPDTKPAETEPPVTPDENLWIMGWGSAEIPVPENSGEPLYIAGYHGGWEIDGVSDLQRATAVWIDGGKGAVLMISVDCIALSSDAVNDIRGRLEGYLKDKNCVSVNVCATHTHAGLDTLGLWGPTGIDGKNSVFLESLKEAAVTAAKAAYEDRKEGRLYYGSVDTGKLQRDSRDPQVFDPDLYQFRFAPKEDGEGIRVFLYAAHAESMRGDNKLLSRDYPGVLVDTIRERTGDRGIFMNSAIGCLVMTEVQIPEPFDAVKNRDVTGTMLADLALSIENETILSPSLTVTTVSVELPLENIVFQYYKFLGILGSEIRGGDPDGKYVMVTELSVLKMGKLAIALIPGEISPELVLGRELKNADPEALNDIAEKAGYEKLLVVGLCNDEVGYIIPPSRFLLNPDAPYIDRIRDENGEDHYEETNSVGPETAEKIAEAFRKAISGN